MARFGVKNGVMTGIAVAVASLPFVVGGIARHNEKEGYLAAWATKSPAERQGLIEGYTTSRVENLSSARMYGLKRDSSLDARTMFLTSYDPSEASVPEKACINWLYNMRDGSFNPPVMETADRFKQYALLDARRKDAFAEFALSKDNRLLTLDECAEINTQSKGSSIFWIFRNIFK